MTASRVFRAGLKVSGKAGLHTFRPSRRGFPKSDNFAFCRTGRMYFDPIQSGSTSATEEKLSDIGFRREDRKVRRPTLLESTIRCRWWSCVDSDPTHLDDIGKAGIPW